MNKDLCMGIVFGVLLSAFALGLDLAYKAHLEAERTLSKLRAMQTLIHVETSAHVKVSDQEQPIK